MPQTPRLPRILHRFLVTACVAACAVAAEADVSVKIENQGKAISPDLFGIFFEDINYAADGGLYAELIQNRSFDYQATEQLTWNPLTAWELTTRGGGEGVLAIDAADPIHPNNPNYLVLQVREPGDGVGVVNTGFDGIPVKAGESYNLSLFAKQLYLGDRWRPTAGPAGATPPPPVPQHEGKRPPLIVRLESKDGETLGEASLELPAREWTRLTATLTASRTDDAARLVVLANVKSGLAFDMISLFPKKTFHGRPNGLRADLAQVIADLKPHFVRFPGGCLVHGNGLGNTYQWKNTIGPIEQRKGQADLWGYHQSVGLGYFEFFEFCEDIGAKPLPVVSAGVSCQNSGRSRGTGQQGFSLEEMPAYIQDILDLIEYANAPASSTWGAKRAAAGHPESFHLQYLGVGNEDAQTPVFRERFKMIYDAVKAKHPEITVIGTVGPSPDGTGFDAGWKFANELALPFVDEHYYMKPEWFLANQHRYDTYDRTKTKVYVGEYASKGNALANALAEAAYMTSLERNGDVVGLASYAPLLARDGHTQWNPNLIYFNATGVFPTVNYYVQQLFAINAGSLYFSAEVSPAAGDGSAGSTPLAVSCVKDAATGDLILKLVNVGPSALPAQVNLSGFGKIDPAASCTVLTGDPAAKNTPAAPRTVVPATTAFTAGPSFHYDVPANALVIIRMKSR